MAYEQFGRADAAPRERPAAMPSRDERWSPSAGASSNRPVAGVQRFRYVSVSVIWLEGERSLKPIRRHSDRGRPDPDGRGAQDSEIVGIERLW
jgi:hypothetical protein